MWREWHLSIVLYSFCTLLTGPFDSASAEVHCKAEAYGLPGFRSQPSSGSGSDPRKNVFKVAFQNTHGTWLAGHFRDTGSDSVAALFPALAAHKEDWPAPALMDALAQAHGLSSLVIDFSGRGESCGYELAMNYTAAVSKSCIQPLLY